MHKTRVQGPKSGVQLVRTFEDALGASPFIAMTEEGGLALYKQRLLRALTCLDIHFLLYAYIYLLEKCTSMSLAELKVGVIGCGAIGRLILNTLTVFSKQGLKLSNIMVSTRQTEHLWDYQQKYGISVQYDNEKLMRECDVVFLCTPSTLDNWIMVDLKEPYEKRCARQSQVRPLVFILTSNVGAQKCGNVFSGCFLQPTMTHKAIEEFMACHPNFSEEGDQAKLEALEAFAFDKIRSRVPKLYNTMAYVFCNWRTTVESQQQIEPQTHEHLYSCFKKPTVEEVYRQRCKRWHSARMNFLAD